MNQFIRKPKSWATLSLMLIIFSLFCLTSCKVAKDVAKESLIESITDPKTGTQVFVKDYDTDPYAINVGKIINPSLIFNCPFFLLSSTLHFSFAVLCTTNFFQF